MTKPSPEEIAKAIVEQWSNELLSRAVRGQMSHGQAQIMLEQIIAQAIQAERQRTMPSYPEYFEAYKKHDPSFCNEFDLRWAYEWLTERTK